MATSDNLFLWELTASTSISATDIVYAVQDPTGTPIHSYILYSDFTSGLPVDITNDTDPVVGGDLQGNNFTLGGFEGVINNQTGTTYTLATTDLGLTVFLDNASPITLTVPNTLPAGWNCLIAQKGAGQVTVSAAASGNLRNYDSHTKLAGQYATASILIESNAGTAPEIWFQGRTST